MERDELIREIDEELHSFKRHGGSGGRFEDNSCGRVLKALRHAEGEVHPTDLCHDLGVTTPRITSILNEMEERGLIERHISDKDRRKIVVVLSEAGKLEIDSHKQRAEKRVADLINMVGNEDAETFLRVLKAMKKIGR